MSAAVVRVRSVVWLVTAAMIGAVVAAVVLAAWRVDAAPGDSDATFVPTAGCRAFDYRPAPNQVGPRSEPLGAGEVFVQQITGGVGECVGELAIPGDAVGVAMNVTAVGPTAQSNLRLFPADLTEVPLISNLNFSAGQAPFPNKVDVSLSPSGAIKLFNQNGQVSVVGDVVGYYSTASLSELHTRLNAVEAELDTLLGRLEGVSRLEVDGIDTLRFSGVNVQVVDGRGSTPCGGTFPESCTSVGNLIIGYNEDANLPAVRSGSHNLVVGTHNSWVSYGGIVAGSFNTIEGPYSNVLGGNSNTAGGTATVVTGGAVNATEGSYASVLGGYGNTATSQASSISGGRDNEANAFWSSVSGGRDNTAGSNGASVSGGNGNAASGVHSSVSGGLNNEATSTGASVSGGSNNDAVNTASSVSGGANNTAGGERTSVSGGFMNQATGENDSVAGGDGVTCSFALGARVCGDGLGGPL